MSKKHISLYRKWRSQSLEEIIGQEFTVKTLTNALTSEKLAHAYLFSGPRGTGKTSLARILAKSVNCFKNGISAKPCQECESCKSITNGTSLDVMEIDAASNRGVDDIRQLRERVKFAPVKSRFKVYIIDEVHMLTGEAFNALLKTLEEPPEHVIFIMATTEPHKIPITILSRIMRFDLKRIPTELQVKLLRKIADSEEINITDLALHKLAVQSNGSLRDSESMLDQIASFSAGKIDAEEVSSLLGMMSEDFLHNLLSTISKLDRKSAIEMVRGAYQGGRDPGQIVNDFLIHIHVIILRKLGVTAKELVSEYALSEEMIENSSKLLSFEGLRNLELTLRETSGKMRYAFSPLAELEMAILDLIDVIDDKKPKVKTLTKPISQPEKTTPQIKTQQQQQQSSPPTQPESKPEKSVQPVAPPPEEDNSLLGRIKSLAKKNAIILYAFLSSALSARIENDLVVLVFPSTAEFEKNRLLEPETNQKLKNVVSELSEDVKGVRIEMQDVGDISKHKDIKSAAALFGAKIKE